MDKHKGSSTLWKVVNTLSLPSFSTPLLYRNGTVIYACLNMIRTWNWMTNQEKSRFIFKKRDSITALAELESKGLVVGTEKGRIYVEKTSSWIESAVGRIPVNKILVIGPSHVVVEFENGQKSLINIDNGSHLVNYKKETKVCKFKHNFLASLREGVVKIRRVRFDRLESSKYCHRSDKSYSDIRAERCRFLLLRHKGGGKFTIWDPLNGLTLEASLDPEIHTDQFKTLVLLDFNTFIEPYYNFGHRRCYVRRKSYDKDRGAWIYVSKSELAGCWEVSSMIQVDDCIIYATKPMGSGIHVFDQNLGLSFSSKEFTNKGKEDPRALIALRDGCVAIQLPGSVCIIKAQKPKTRLFIGEGDFSFTEAFIEKHKLSARTITATEIKTRHEVDEEERLERLSAKGVELRFEVNAERIHEYFPSRRFERIHWNCPYGKSSVEMKAGAFRDVIPNFFASCKKVQHIGDRVHVTLIQEKDIYSKIDYWRIRQMENPIVAGSSWSGYRLIKKRAFGKKRYPGYGHKNTEGGYSHSSNDKMMREFVLEKVCFKEEYSLEKSLRIKHLGSTNYYFNYKTDDSDSSDDAASGDYDESFSGEMKRDERDRWMKVSNGWDEWDGSNESEGSDD